MATLKFKDSFTYKLAKEIILFWALFQLILMSIYFTASFVEGQPPSPTQIMDRWSLSDAQALGLASAYGLIKTSFTTEKASFKMGISFNKMYGDENPKKIKTTKIKRVK